MTDTNSKKRKPQTLRDRTRCVQEVVRFTEAEHAAFVERVKKSGLSKQQFLLSASLNSEITAQTKNEISEAIHKLTDIHKSVRKVGNDQNQIAHTLNIYQDDYYDVDDLEEILSSIKKDDEKILLEVEELCRLLKTSMAKAVDTKASLR